MSKPIDITEQFYKITTTGRLLDFAKHLVGTYGVDAKFTIPQSWDKEAEGWYDTVLVTPMTQEHVWQKDEVFCYGSNESGVHMAGAARYALDNCGALMYKTGYHGNSYGVSTKDKNIQTLPLPAIYKHVREFLDFAEDNSNLKFFVTAIGTGLAGIPHVDMARMFVDAPSNCRLPPEWGVLIDQWKIEQNAEIPK